MAVSAQSKIPKTVIAKFIGLMDQLPIDAVIFSPAIVGVECYSVIRIKEGVEVKKSHEYPRYVQYISEFKKPRIGRFVVMRDIAKEQFGLDINENNPVMIRDTGHDKAAAESFGLPFMEGDWVHNGLEL